MEELPRKLLRLIELLRELQGNKVLVFVQWTAHVKYLRTLLKQHGVPSLALAGDVGATMDGLRRFQQDGEPDVLLLSFERHASGINLQFCRHVVLVHPYCPPETTDAAFVAPTPATHAILT